MKKNNKKIINLRVQELLSEGKKRNISMNVIGYTDSNYTDSYHDIYHDTYTDSYHDGFCQNGSVIIKKRHR